jgi:hypothetical protein
MKIHIVTFAGISVLVLFALVLASIFEIRLASAQADATSSPAISITTPIALVASTSTALLAAVASSTPAATATSTMPAITSTQLAMTADASSASDVTTSTTSASASTTAVSTPIVEPPPKGLAKVHIIGTKYTDYFTDGKSVTTFPGDPAIDSNFDKPDAPIPTHAGLTWDHTSGGYLYDTPSGDLEVGDYAAQPNGAYIENAPPFVSSTSTPTQTATSTTTAQTSSSAASSIPPSNG